MAKVGVVLSGCGVHDGSEIHEAVLTLLHLDKAGQEIIPLAPNILQSQVIDHLNQEEIERENRDLLVEAARITRGDIQSLDTVNKNELDAIILPGGAGAIKNLTNYAFIQENCKINPQVQNLIEEMIDLGKPVGAICISPLVVARALVDTDYTPRLTVGKDCEVAQYIQEELNAVHIESKVSEVVVDEDLKIVTTPAYMLAESISNIDTGIKSLVDNVIKLI
ncbi:isoprenoid biosynthesis glyoxalase ElbB [Selenihalanaerobacter shriftii]|uniref:Enhancing lycopene biosynthesis protein 2 n=1 Tax=Selenihalanaerobacter shriftii TaxID=142842 RepID=A0A1T4JWK0_9FIRM|nr:isoprenoid biosynthesis glyoxalase ElbB [Selenihalanaerobacter shriftii]SJZ34447.1 Enhancing lycopene biosynthesis protein 2 [Selenihalanaerobacter shriftii]